MITCRKAAAWMSRDLDLPLALPARMVLLAHLAICGNCHRFRRQLSIIDRVTAEWLRSEVAGRGKDKLSADVSADIARRCRETGG